jgi:hypothetical protein
MTGFRVHRNRAIEKALMYASELLSLLTIRTVDVTKIANEMLVLFISLFRK